MKKSTKILLSLTLVLILALVAVVAVPYYVWGINIFDQSGWATSESGEVQYHDFYGDPLTEWQLIEDKWYYFAPDDGGMETGWLELPEGRFYLGSDGVRQTGWLELRDGTYYINPTNATMATLWQEIDGNTYYLGTDGRKCSGWQDIAGKRYLFNDQGHLLTGWQTFADYRYYLGTDGAMLTGWVETELGRSYLGTDGILRTGWTDTDEGRFYLDENGVVTTGWLETEEGIYYLDENGQPVTGWIERDGHKVYLTEAGMLATGWQDIDGDRYYFRENGAMARGKVIIDDTAYYFTSTGKHVQMVNRWNPVPADYRTDLVTYRGWQVSQDCYDDLVAMLKAVGDVGYYEITSAYRSVGTQQYIWDKRMNNYLASGYSKDAAYTAVIQSVAVPGTSEHHLGLAVDISGGTAVHGWLAEHSWEYGFIVRYPDGKTHITGIVYEPWHYRYLGRELAEEIYKSGLTMEEYMDQLTQEEGYGAGTASDPEKFP